MDVVGTYPQEAEQIQHHKAVLAVEPTGNETKGKAKKGMAKNSRAGDEGHSLAGKHCLGQTKTGFAGGANGHKKASHCPACKITTHIICKTIE